MKILLASTPATGHLNPLIAIASFLVEDGHDVVFLCSTAYRARIERSGFRFHGLRGEADVDLGDLQAMMPELKDVEPGLDWLRTVFGRVFVDKLADQYAGLQELLSEFRADAIITDDMFYGLLPMLLGPRSKRPPVLACGTSVLRAPRDDKAPFFLGLPPAKTPAEFREYEIIAREYDERVDQPTLDRLNLILKKFGVGPVTMPLFETTLRLADTYMQLSVPSFEFPRTVPASVKFLGSLPMIPAQAPVPPWAKDLDGKRKVVLVTQGTIANHDFGLLTGPTLAALANEPDLLVVATAGGRSITDIPGPIPDNARLAQFLPFEWLLPKVDVLVTNGGYGSVNQALSFGMPIVTAGLTEDKADVNARIAWSGAGINLKSNSPGAAAIHDAVRAALDTPHYRQNAQRLAAEFAAIDAKAEILRLLREYERMSSSRAA